MDTTQICADFKENGTKYTVDQLLDYINDTKKIKAEWDQNDHYSIMVYDNEIEKAKMILKTKT